MSEQELTISGDRTKCLVTDYHDGVTIQLLTETDIKNYVNDNKQVIMHFENGFYTYQPNADSWKLISSLEAGDYTTKCLVVMHSIESLSVEGLTLTEQEVKKLCDDGKTIIKYFADDYHYYSGANVWEVFTYQRLLEQKEQQVKEQDTTKCLCLILDSDKNVEAKWLTSQQITDHTNDNKKVIRYDQLEFQSYHPGANGWEVVQDTTKCLIVKRHYGEYVTVENLTEEQIEERIGDNNDVVRFDMNDFQHYNLANHSWEVVTDEGSNKVNKFYLLLEKREVVLATEEDAKAWMECDEAVIVQLNTSTLQLSRWNDSKSRWEIIG